MDMGIMGTSAKVQPLFWGAGQSFLACAFHLINSGKVARLGDTFLSSALMGSSFLRGLCASFQFEMR